MVDTTALSPEQKALATVRLQHRLVDGSITVVSSQYRSQHRNRESAKARLEELVAGAVVPPKRRRATRPTRGSVERRLDAKKQRSKTKQSRRGTWD